MDRWAIVVFWIRRVRVQGTLQRRGVERLWDEDNQSSNVFTAIDPDVDDGSWNCRLAREAKLGRYTCLKKFRGSLTASDLRI